MANYVTHVLRINKNDHNRDVVNAIYKDFTDREKIHNYIKGVCNLERLLLLGICGRIAMADDKLVESACIDYTLDESVIRLIPVKKTFYNKREKLIGKTLRLFLNQMLLDSVLDDSVCTLANNAYAFVKELGILDKPFTDEECSTIAKYSSDSIPRDKRNGKFARDKVDRLFDDAKQFGNLDEDTYCLNTLVAPRLAYVITQAVDIYRLTDVTPTSDGSLNPIYWLYTNEGYTIHCWAFYTKIKNTDTLLEITFDTKWYPLDKDYLEALLTYAEKGAPLTIDYLYHSYDNSNCGKITVSTDESLCAEEHDDIVFKEDNDVNYDIIEPKWLVNELV